MIVVTGATGFVGREIVRQARAEGFPVRAIVRNPKAARGWAERHGVELFAGDVLDAASLEGAMSGATCVIHLVGIIVERGESTFERVHTQATENMVSAARKAGVKRFLQMSALGTRPEARSRYHKTKWAAEQCVRNSGLAWTIFRPSLIYGAGDKSIRVLTTVVRRLPVVPVLGSGNGRIQPVAVETVAQCFVRAVENNCSIGRTYDVCGPVAFTWNALYDKLLTHLGRRKPKLHLPLPVARATAAVLEALLPHPPFTRDQLLMIEEDNTGDPGPVVRDFRIEPEPFEMGLARYLGK